MDVLKGKIMVIAGEKANALVFYDRETGEVCAMVTDDDIVIPENCEFAYFPEGVEPLFKDIKGTVKLSGAILERGVI